MCRVLSYLGKSISVSSLIHEPDNSLIKQSYNPRFMSHIQNLAGFGLLGWDYRSVMPERPYVYKTRELPFFDKNLQLLADKIHANCLLAHVRGVNYSIDEVVSYQNIHPFFFENTRLFMAHNGNMEGFDFMKYDLLKYIKPEIASQIAGTTDSEWIYALLISQLMHNTTQLTCELNEVIPALTNTLEILQKVRLKRGLNVASPVNLFLTNGYFLLATRFVFDYGNYPPHHHSLAHLAYHSLWYTFGENYGCYDGEYKMVGDSQRKLSVIFASEPLTEDTTSWIEVPEYSMIAALPENDEIKIAISDIDI
ncbi:MAG: class II glutamine amidotransferase [Gammaproteobacteria bacterium]